jgi:2-polyprenyl-3-methyl-5-hydroxy-6-metoxy-1,4-benzoquinol methylase
MEIVCPLCKKSAAFLFEIGDLNRHVSNKIFNYWRCLDCELIFLTNIPENTGEYYQDEYYRIPSIRRMRKIARAQKYQIDLVQKYVKSDRLLEIGPGVGYFAYQAKEAGFKVDAIEQDDRCCDFLSKVIGVNAVKSNSPHMIIDTMKSHDVITMWHVIEHLPDPWTCLDSAARNLSPGGILLIATPNPISFQFRLLGASWPHVDAPRHLHLIPIGLLIRYLSNLGLEPVKIVSKDKGIKYLNRFGWQRYLINLFPNKPLKKFWFFLGYLLGYLFSFPMKIWECRGLRGSAYTVVFRNSGSASL